MNLSYDVVMTYLRPILIALALSLAAITPPASAQDFQKGFDAHERGDSAHGRDLMLHRQRTETGMLAY